MFTDWGDCQVHKQHEEKDIHKNRGPVLGIMRFKKIIVGFPLRNARYHASKSEQAPNRKENYLLQKNFHWFFLGNDKPNERNNETDQSMNSVIHIFGQINIYNIRGQWQIRVKLIIGA